MVLRPHLYCLPSWFTIVRSLYWVLGLCGVSPVFSVAFARTIPAPILVLALRRAAGVAVFSPIPWFFALVWGLLFLLRNFSASAGYAYGVAFFAPSAYSPLISILRWLALWVLAAGPHLWWSVCVCRISFWGGGAVSSFSPPARCGVDSCWPLLVWLLCLFRGHLRFSAACPAAGYP